MWPCVPRNASLDRHLISASINVPSAFAIDAGVSYSSHGYVQHPHADYNTHLSIRANTFDSITLLTDTSNEWCYSPQRCSSALGDSTALVSSLNVNGNFSFLGGGQPVQYPFGALVFRLGSPDPLHFNMDGSDWAPVFTSNTSSMLVRTFTALDGNGTLYLSLWSVGNAVNDGVLPVDIFYQPDSNVSQCHNFTAPVISPFDTSAFFNVDPTVYSHPPTDSLVTQMSTVNVFASLPSSFCLSVIQDLASQMNVSNPDFPVSRYLQCEDVEPQVDVPRLGPSTSP